MSKKSDEPFRDTEILDVIQEVTGRSEEPPIITSARLAKELGMTRRATSRRLKKIANSEDTSLKMTKIGGKNGTNIYWREENEMPPIIPDRDREIFEDFVEGNEVERYEALRYLVEQGLKEIHTDEAVLTKWENRELRLWGMTSAAAKGGTWGALIFVVFVFLNNIDVPLPFDVSAGLELLVPLSLLVSIAAFVVLVPFYLAYLIIHFVGSSRLDLRPVVLQNRFGGGDDSN